MSLVLLVGFQFGQSRLHLLSVRFMRFKVLFMRPPLFDECFHRSTCLLVHLPCLSKRGINRLEPFWYFSALIFNLHDTDIQLLQFDMGGEILVQYTPIAVVRTTISNRCSSATALVGPLGLEPRTS